MALKTIAEGILIAPLGNFPDHHHKGLAARGYGNDYSGTWLYGDKSGLKKNFNDNKIVKSLTKNL